jgi:alpha-L-arabinofuranosidase
MVVSTVVRGDSGGGDNPMRTITVQLRADDVIGTTDRRLFSAFIEHLGRCVYGGIFEPGHPTIDAHGFRGDVLALVRSLDEAMPMEYVTSRVGTLRLRAARQLHHAGLNAVNTREDPMQVSPTSLDGVRIEGAREYATLAAASWTMIRLDITR